MLILNGKFKVNCVLGSWTTALCKGKVSCWWRMEKEHLRLLHGIQNMEFNDKCVILMRCLEATSGKCSEKYSETHIPSGCRIDDKNKANYIHTWLFIFSYSIFSYSSHSHIPFSSSLSALSGSSVTSGALIGMVAALKLSVPSPWNALGDVVTKTLRCLCVFLPVCVHFYSTYKLSRHDSQACHKYEYGASVLHIHSMTKSLATVMNSVGGKSTLFSPLPPPLMNNYF